MAPKINFSLEGRSAADEDVVRTFQWELLIPGIAQVVKNTSGVADLVEGLRTRVRSGSMKGNSITEIESIFMGQKQFFPGKKEIVADMSIEFEETQNMIVHNTFIEWMNAVMNSDQLSDKVGTSSYTKKRGGYALDMTLILYDYSGERVLREILYKNAWPKNISDVDLTYDGTDAMKFSVDFRFDTWVKIQ